MYIVYDFPSRSLAEIADGCVDDEIRTAAHCSSKNHLRYISDYLDFLDCKRIILETEYVDRDYLTDYAGFYARSFTGYPRFCSRLHFFENEFSQDHLDEWIRGERADLGDDLEEGYLGYLVLKPLPDTFIGRTCLKTYGPDGGRRNFQGTREYRSHLAGFELEIDSLAFQEQDRVAAACATSAIWSSLHKVGRTFGTPVPTPVEITKSAADRSRGRALPSQGLTLEQMCWAIKETGLEIELRQGKNVQDFKGLIYGYTKFGLAAILGLALYDSNNNFVGRHAATVSGYSLPNGPPNLWRSDNLDELYVHDDQVGPFASIEFDGDPALATNHKVERDLVVKTQFPVSSPPAKGVVTSVVVPVYEKIRVRFEDARKQLNRLTAMIRFANGLSGGPPQFDPEWDLYLTTVTQFRSATRRDAAVPANLQEQILSTNWPRFLWRAIGRDDGEVKVDILMDATDIHQAYLIRRIFFRDPALGGHILRVLQDQAAFQALTRLLPEPWVEQLEGSVHQHW